MSPDELNALTAPTKLDLAIASAFPAWGAKRLQARRQFAYEAARSTRLRNSAKTLTGPEDMSVFRDRIGLMMQVRDLEANFGLFQSIIDKLALYAFGRVKYQARTGDKAINVAYEDYLSAWFDNCDVSGRHDFQGLTNISFKSELRDGDYGNKWRRDGGWLKLQGIESDRIGGTLAVSMADDYFQGITVDLDTGKPLTYAVYTRNKVGAYSGPVDVGASDMLLLFDPRRIDQYRGITPFAPIVNEARDLKEVLEACLQGTKFENYHAAIGYTPSGQPLSAPEDLINSTETNANGVSIKEQQLKYGMIQWAPSDAEYEFMKSDRPSGNFQTYIDMLIRLQGIALNLPYSFMYSMMGTGPAVRADLQQAHRVIEWHQCNTARRFMTPAKNTALMDGIARGEIPYTPKWANGKWQFAPSVSIDGGRDANANVAMRNAGLLSADSIFSEDGEDAEEQEAIINEEQRRKIESATKIADEFKVDRNIVLTMLGVQTPNGFLFTTPETPTAGSGADGADPAKGAPAEPTEMQKRDEVRNLIRSVVEKRRRFDASVGRSVSRTARTQFNESMKRLRN